MLVQMTIIGMGQIGTSIGLALKEHGKSIYRRGYDKELGLSNKAKARGAVDERYINLPNAVSEADIVLLALPVNEIRRVLEIIAPDLKEGAVVLDTAPVKSAVTAWARELLPPERYYVGLMPVLNPAYLYRDVSGQEAAHPDLFRGMPMVVAAPPGTPSEAVKLAADLAQLLGAAPLFAELAEVDSLMTRVDLLPRVLAAALVGVTAERPGWREGRQLTGRAYAETTASLGRMQEAAALSQSLALNRESALRVLDEFMGVLQQIRADLEAEDDAALQTRLEKAQEAHLRWWGQRLSGDWQTPEAPQADLPSGSGMLARMLGFGRRKRSEE